MTSIVEEVILCIFLHFNLKHTHFNKTRILDNLKLYSDFLKRLSLIVSDFMTREGWDIN